MGSEYQFATRGLPVPTPLGYERLAPTSVRAYLHNNLQLIRIGLATSCPPQQHAPTTPFFNSTPSASLPLMDLISSPFDIWPSAVYSATQLDKITSRDTELSRRAWPAIHCIKTRDQFSSLNMPERNNKEHSDNVPLFLNQRNTEEGGLERFQPTLLMSRFEKWRMAQDRVCPPDVPDDDPEVLDIEDDIRLLEEEGEFLFSNQIGLGTYKGLCTKHGLQRALKTAPTEGAVDTIMDQFLRIDHDDVPTSPVGSSPDDILEDADTQDLLMLGQGPIMDLWRLVGWAAYNSDVTQTKTKKSVQAMVDPDFVLEQGPPLSASKAVEGTLKQIWPRLDGAQQRHLMALLARMLVSIWDHFDILNNDTLDSFSTHYGTETLSLKTGTALGHQEAVYCQTRPEGAGPWTLHDFTDQPTAGATSDRQSPEDHLRRLEDEFMSRSFLDAIREATKPPLSNHAEYLDRRVGDRLLHRARNPFTLLGSSGGVDDLGGTSRKDYPPWNLNDIDTNQRMTTTRAKAKESHCAQDRTFILPLRPSSTQECGAVCPFDFSLDDLLIQANIGEDNGSTLASMLQDPKIIGVSRWKSIGPRQPPTLFLAIPKELLPRSSNVFQTTAQGSPYPLVHLFSLPDVFCPVQFGGQEKQEQDQDGLAHVLARLLARQRPQAAEFLTDPVEDKERRMYHRWMAAWHERSPRAPRATRTRYEMMKILRQHSQEGRRLSGHGDNSNEDHIDYYGHRRYWDENNIPPSLRPSGRGLPQPKNKEGADISAPSSAWCSRCRYEWNEQEKTRREKERFHDACRRLDRIIAQEDREVHHRGNRQDRQKRKLEYAQQVQWDQVRKETMALGLGLSNAQQHSLSQLLGLGLGLGIISGGTGMGIISSAGAGSTNDINNNSNDSILDEGKARTTSHPWQLTEEEQAIVDIHLWGDKRRPASSPQHHYARH
ncbi:hypothetical protein BGX23_003029 [Mortierella sp. AD031]|nr:hypothetical protein BGX23_003029 [Mortierella sp. AD031]